MVYLLFFLSQSYVLGRMVGWGYVQPGTNGWSISSKVGDAMRPEATETAWLFQGVWKMSWSYWTLPFLRNPCWTIYQILYGGFYHRFQMNVDEHGTCLKENTHFHKILQPPTPKKLSFLRFIGRKLSWPCEPWNYEVRSHWYTLRSSL